MAWNEPGGGRKDPWSGQNGSDDQGPPDLDEVVRKLQERFARLFGNRQPTGGGNNGDTGPRLGKRTVVALVVIALLAWSATGIYIVDPAERGVVMRFGRYVATTEPGPHWHLPVPVESVIKVNVDEISTLSHKAAILTQDENIVEVELTVQSRIQDAADYLFQVRNPESTLNDATATVTRVIVGRRDLDFVMTEGRGAVAVSIKEGIQRLLDRYRTGLLVTSVNMQPAKPPEQVKAAFDDAIKAREDKERIENQAQAYANEVLPNANGQAARILADAKAYRDRVVAEAEGEGARFIAVLDAYAKAPEVTRERLYIETMQNVLGSNSKVMLDVQNGADSLIYLPVDQLLKQRTAAFDQGSAAAPRSSSTSDATARSRNSDNSTRRVVDRERRSRND